MSFKGKTSTPAKKTNMGRSSISLQLKWVGTEWLGGDAVPWSCMNHQGIRDSTWWWKEGCYSAPLVNWGKQQQKNNNTQQSTKDRKKYKMDVGARHGGCVFSWLLGWTWMKNSKDRIEHERKSQKGKAGNDACSWLFEWPNGVAKQENMLQRKCI